MIEAASTSETSVNFYQTTRRNNSEDSHLLAYLNTQVGGPSFEYNFTFKVRYLFC
jgi:hypothetical protein